MRYDTSREALERDTTVEFYRAGGPGGQHKNKTETAVRLVHEPSGQRVVATEQRSRTQNLERAFERLAERLERMQVVQKPRRATKPTLGSKRRRVEGKTQRGATKKLRGRVRDE